MTRLSWTGIWGNIISTIGSLIAAIMLGMYSVVHQEWYWIILFFGSICSLFFISVFITMARCKVIAGIFGLFYGFIIGGVLILISEEKRVSNIPRTRY